VPSTAAAAFVPTVVGTTVSSGNPSLPGPNPNNDGKGKGKGKGKNNGSGNNSGNNSRGTPAWPSFYNPWTDTISMWPGMHPLQQPTRPP
jgi:hypothetical protein